MANVYPFAREGYTMALTALHLPIALWLVVGIAYAGRRWSEVAGWMDFIRFSGELFIYYVLIALGGGVLVGFMALIFQAIGIDIEPFFELWLLPTGAVGALISALLVDAVALWAIAARITEFGFSPNRVAALGMNVILLVNLACSAVLYARFHRGHDLERWQTDYMPAHAVWAAFVVSVFPPLFGVRVTAAGGETAPVALRSEEP